MNHVLQGRRQVSSPLQNLPRQGLKRSVCTCPNPTLASKAVPLLPRLSLFWEQSSHLPRCSFYRNAEISDIFGAQFTICGRYLEHLLSATFSYSRGAGGWSISRNLTCSVSVDVNSPAFRLTDSVGYLLSYKQQTVLDCVELYRRCMVRLFESKRASPYDKSRRGTLFHVRKGRRCTNLLYS
jgi:hypothetical protein